MTYGDNQAVDVTSLASSNVTVSPPSGGAALSAAFVSASPSTDGTPVTATYSITPPGGSWTSADNGTYAVNLQAGQVADTGRVGLAALGDIDGHLLDFGHGRDQGAHVILCELTGLGLQSSNALGDGFDPAGLGSRSFQVVVGDNG